jgi:hypothetical protein
MEGMSAFDVEGVAELLIVKPKKKSPDVEEVWLYTM